MLNIYFSTWQLFVFYWTKNIILCASSSNIKVQKKSLVCRIWTGQPHSTRENPSFTCSIGLSYNSVHFIKSILLRLVHTSCRLLQLVQWTAALQRYIKSIFTFFALHQLHCSRIAASLNEPSALFPISNVWPQWLHPSQCDQMLKWKVAKLFL